MGGFGPDACRGRSPQRPAEGSTPSSAAERGNGPTDTAILGTVAHALSLDGRSARRRPSRLHRVRRSGSAAGVALASRSRPCSGRSPSSPSSWDMPGFIANDGQQAASRASSEVTDAIGARCLQRSEERPVACGYRAPRTVRKRTTCCRLVRSLVPRRVGSLALGGAMRPASNGRNESQTSRLGDAREVALPGHAQVAHHRLTGTRPDVVGNQCRQ